MRLLSGTLAALALSAPIAAVAADLPVKARPIPVVMVYNWTGFYVGGNAGYSWGRASTDQVDASSTTTTTRLFRGTTPPANEITGLSPFNAPTGTFPQVVTTTAADATSSRTNVNGFVGGLQAGYNWQIDRSWLFGLEADFQGSSERGSVSVCSTANCLAGTAIGTGDYRLRWFGTVRGRVGVLPTERLLLYVTGGLAYGRFDQSLATGLVGTTLLGDSTSTTRAGWTFGGGAEGAIDNHWTWKVEYLYMDLGSFASNFGGGSSVGAPVVTTTSFGTSGPVTQATAITTVTGSASTRFSDNIVRVGLNYRFGPDPVVARY
jgi:outer membrane immunogenic protein